MNRIISNEPYSTSRKFLITGAIWGVGGALYGVVAALALIAPDLIGFTEYLTFGRLRPIHVNVVALGFVYSLMLAAVSYIVPRLCGLKSLWSEKLGNVIVYLWNLVFLVAAVTLHTGMTQGREYAELIWWIDALVAFTLILFTFNIYMTMARRKQKILYVSLWYIGGGLAWTLTIYTLGNIMFNYPSGSLTGIIDSIWLWFYGHNVVGLILTPLAIALAYWVLPRAAKTPIWNHTMSLMGFWILLVIYTHTGTHHLIQAPVPQWLKVISIVDSIALLIPVLAVLLNLWLPLRGKLALINQDIGAKFVFTGTIWYLLVCIQGPLHALPSVQRLTHFTHWVVAHAHIAILGFAGFIAIGAAYTILPLVTGKKLYSRRLAGVQYWLLQIGLISMFAGLTAAGLVQGTGWLNGEAFYRIVAGLNIYMIMRAVSGIMILASLCLFFYNVYKTVRQPAGSPVDASGEAQVEAA